MVRSLARPLVFAPVLWVGLFAPAAASADPIVLRNTSYIFGYVTLLQDGMPVGGGQYFDTAEAGIRAPLSGGWVLSDSRTIDAGGATVIASSDLGASFSYDNFSRWTFSGSSTTVAFAFLENPAAGAGAQAWARSVYNVTFEVPEPTTYDFDGRYFGQTESVYAALVGRLEGESGWPILFSDVFQSFSGSLDERRFHSGRLEPGVYNLVLVSDPVYLVAPGQMLKEGGFEFTFDMTPVPEPGTMILLGSGLAVAAGRALRRRRGARV